MVYMFNELSMMKVDSIEIACNLLENFVVTYIRAKEIGFTELRLYENALPNLYQIPLHSDYNVDSWLKDNRINSDLRDRFREIVTSSPLITETEIEQKELYSRSEFYKTNLGTQYQVWGLGAAFIYDTLSVSIGTQNEWYKSEVKIAHYHLSEYADEVTDNVLVKHFADVESLNTHLDWWESYQLNRLHTSAELWNRRFEFFPNLELCGIVESQLQRIGVSKILLQIIERLKSLDEYVKKWKIGDFNYEDANKQTNLRISPESDLTLQKFGTLRKFAIPNQEKQIFSLHIKTGDYRFHFYPDNDNRKVYVGYIGKHLRIASEN